MIVAEKECFIYECDMSIITNEEKALFKFMDEFCKSEFVKQKLIKAKKDPDDTNYNHKILQKAIDSSQHITLRVAGGWVRDLLLKKQSDDIDFCVDVMKGLTTATYLDEYVRKQYLDQGIFTYDGIELTKFKIVKMDENVDAGKNIAPANIVPFFGLNIDFVNLRTEEYDELSRKPIVKFGTFFEDSYRRDLTLNALFYNIHTKKIEDCTMRGYSDLITDKIIKTPLDPIKTFTDDPLRLLRTLRFISKLGPEYTLDPVLYQFIKELHTHNTVMDALAIKIKRSRFAKEMHKLFQGIGAINALTVIGESMALTKILFCVPHEVKTKDIFDKKAQQNSHEILGKLRIHNTLVTNELNKNIVSNIDQLYHDYHTNVQVPEQQLLGKDKYFILFYSLLAIKIVQGSYASPYQINQYMDYMINNNIGVSKDYADHINLICNIVMFLQSINSIPETESNKILIESQLFSILTNFKGKYMSNKVLMSYYLAKFIYTEYLKRKLHPYFNTMDINKLYTDYNFVAKIANPIKDNVYRSAFDAIVQDIKKLTTMKAYLSYQCHNGNIPKDISAIKDHKHIITYHQDPNKELFGMSFYTYEMT